MCAPGDADPVGNCRPADVRHDIRAVCAEFNRRRRARPPRSIRTRRRARRPPTPGAPSKLVMRVVAVQDRRAARLEPEKDFGLGLGDGFYRGEMREVHGLDRRDDRHVRPHHAASAA